MARRAHQACVESAEFGEVMRATSYFMLNRLEKARRDAGVSQQRLSAVIGVNREAMRDRLVGRTQLKADELAALAAFLEIDVGDFFPALTRV